MRLVPERVDHGSQALYYVRAPGRAWAPIAIDHAGGGERTVELARAGTLEVRLIGNAPWLRPVVCLWPPEASSTEAYAHARSAPDADDRLTLPQAWGEDGIQLVFTAQGEASVWNDGELVVPLAEMERDGETQGASRLTWSLELPVAGDYEVVVAPLALRRLLHVPAGGLRDVEIDVPAPADVEVKVVDLANGTELFVERLYWSPPRVEESPTPLLQATADPRSRRVSFRAPAGAIGIKPLGYELFPENEEALFEVHPGHNVVEYPVHRLVEVHLRFLDGEATVPWSWAWGIGAERIDGESQDNARGIGKLWFREEGTYELHARGDLAPFEGFEETLFQVRFPAPGEEPSVVDVYLRRP